MRSISATDNCSLNMLFGMAMLDENFEAVMLDCVQRAELLKQYPISEQMQIRLRNVQVDSLSELAQIALGGMVRPPAPVSDSH